MSSQKQSEKDTEKYLCERVEQVFGGIAYKFTSPMRRGVPDRMCCIPGGFHFFVEVKSEGVAPNSGQIREIGRIRDMEHPVWVVDTKESVDHMIKVVLQITDSENLEERVPRGTLKPVTGRLVS